MGTKNGEGGIRTQSVPPVWVQLLSREPDSSALAPLHPSGCSLLVFKTASPRSGIRTLGTLTIQLLSREPDSTLSHSPNRVAEISPEKVGFEPTEPLGSTVFKTASFNHSDTSPRIKEDP